MDEIYVDAMFMCNLSTETLLRSDLLLPMSIKGIVFRAMDVQGFRYAFPLW